SRPGGAVSLHILDPDQDDMSSAPTWSGSLDLWGTDFLLLARLLFTLSTFVECVGTSQPEKRNMLCRTLLDLLYHTKSHPEVAIRRANFYALSRVLAVMDSNTLLTHFSA